MPYKIILVAVLALSLGFSSAKTYGQKTKDFRINEFLVKNDSSFVDDFGRHSAWIEIFNSANSPVSLGGLYLTNNLQQPTKYLIPTGDQRTAVAPHGYAIFWADSKVVQGPLHLNFDLKNSKLIALFAADGKTLIDSVSISASQKADVSYGRQQDGGMPWVFFTKATPNSNNDVNLKDNKSQNLRKMDASGFGKSLIAVLIVFVILVILGIFYKRIARALGFKYSEEEESETVAAAETKTAKDTTPEEISAAIATTLYLYQKESSNKTKLTIRRESKVYSPWSSKIYGLTKSPR